MKGIIKGDKKEAEMFQAWFKWGLPKLFSFVTKFLHSDNLGGWVG